MLFLAVTAHEEEPAATGLGASAAGLWLDTLTGWALASGMAATLLGAIGLHLGLAFVLGLTPRGGSGV